MLLILELPAFLDSSAETSQSGARSKMRKYVLVHRD